MPKIYDENGFVVYVLLPPREHGPAHVHIERGGGEARILLGDHNTAPSIWDLRGMRARDAGKALRIVAANQAEFLQQWEKHHGKLDAGE